MTSLRTHSTLFIRKNDTSISSLELPTGLSLGVHALGYELNSSVLIDTSIIPAEYAFGGYRLGFKKERGELLIGDLWYHVEIISYTDPTTMLLKPIIVRLWNLFDHVETEYLISSNVSEFRYTFMGLPASGSGDIITRLVDYLSSQLEGPVPNDILSILGIHTFGLGSIPFGTTGFPILTPNINPTRFRDKFYEVIYGPGLVTALSTLVASFYEPFRDERNLLQFYGILTGQISHNKTSHFYHPGYSQGTRSGILSMHLPGNSIYWAFSYLQRIHFDYYSITIRLINQFDVIVEQFDSMSGINLPMFPMNEQSVIEAVCAEFMNAFFDTSYTSESNVVYSDICNGQRYIIDQIHIQRTMDEYLILTIISKELMYEKVFDLILLSIMSPTIPQYQIAP